MKIYGMILMIFMMFALSNCGDVKGSGQLSTEQREVKDFSRVSLNGCGELVITQGDTESLTVEAEDNILPLIETRVKGKTLHIGYDGGPLGKGIRPTRPMKFTLQVINLNELDLSGSGDVLAYSVKADEFAVGLSGSGVIKIDYLEASNLVINMSGSGDVILSGEIEEQDLHLSGSGQYKADKLRCEKATVRLSGSGNALISSEDKLKVDVTGSGSVEYMGDPDVDSSITGSGDIKALEASH